MLLYLLVMFLELSLFKERSNSMVVGKYSMIVFVKIHSSLFASAYSNYIYNICLLSLVI